MPEPSDVNATVRGLLEAAGLPVSEAELEGFVNDYPFLRAAADSLLIDELRYEETPLTVAPQRPEDRER